MRRRPAAATFILRICKQPRRAAHLRLEPRRPAPSAACPGFIPASNYSPNSGSVTVLTNSCVDIPITAICEGEIQPGSCAGYEICIRQTDDPDNYFCCDGQIYAPTQDEVLLKDDLGLTEATTTRRSCKRRYQMRFIAVNDTDQEVRARWSSAIPAGSADPPARRRREHHGQPTGQHPPRAASMCFSTSSSGSTAEDATARTRSTSIFSI
ncbi:MAG: hypothetical protein R3F11_17875 [Verrucomicrobiales bacterium]